MKLKQLLTHKKSWVRGIAVIFYQRNQLHTEIYFEYKERQGTLEIFFREKRFRRNLILKGEKWLLVL